MKQSKGININQDFIRTAKAVLFFFFIFSNQVNARWKKSEEFDWFFKNFVIETWVKSKGKYSQTVRRQIKVTTREGQKQAIQALFYTQSHEKLKVLKAYTIYKGKTYQVAKESISEKDSGEDDQSLTGQKIIKIVYPMVNIGSLLVLETQREVFKSWPYDHYIGWEFLNYGKYESYQHNIRSASKLWTSVYNFKQDLELIKHSDKHYLVRSLRPFSREVSNESYISNDSGVFTGYLFSSTRDILRLYRQDYKPFTRYIDSKFPGDFSLKNKKLSIKDKIRAVFDFIREKINYVSDSRTFERGLRPKRPSLTWRDRTGDCKDFTLLAVQLLRQLDIKAYPAIIYRGDDFNSHGINGFDALSIVNHALVYIEQEGKGRFYDPTNPGSFVNYTPSDIADRDAYVFTDPPQVIRVQKYQPKKLKVKTVLSKDLARAKIWIELGPSYREFLEKDLKSKSLSKIQNTLYDLIMIEGAPESIDLKRKNLKKGKFHFEIETRDVFALGTNEKKYYKHVFPRRYLGHLAQKLKLRIKGIQFYLPLDMSFETWIPTKSSTFFAPLGSYSSKWLSFKNSVKKRSDFIVIKDEIKYLSRFVYSKELKDFDLFMKKIQSFELERLVPIAN